MAVQTVSIELIKQWNTERYPIIGSKEARVVLIGEAHYDPDMLKKQHELIDILKPEFVLNEIARMWVYYPKKKEWTPLPGRRLNKTDFLWHPSKDTNSRYLENWGQQVPCIIVGCDMSLQELDLIEEEIARTNPKRYYYRPAIESEEKGRLFDKKNLKRDILPGSPEIMSYRDATMAGNIIQYAKKSSRPIVAIVGANHLAGIKAILKKEKIALIAVDQT